MKSAALFSFLALSSVASATVPGCLLAAINKQPVPSDYKSICGAKANDVKADINSNCGNLAKKALSSFEDSCKAQGYPIDGSATTSSATTSTQETSTQESTAENTKAVVTTASTEAEAKPTQTATTEAEVKTTQTAATEAEAKPKATQTAVESEHDHTHAASATSKPAEQPLPWVPATSNGVAKPTGTAVVPNTLVTAGKPTHTPAGPSSSNGNNQQKPHYPINSDETSISTEASAPAGTAPAGTATNVPTGPSNPHSSSSPEFTGAAGMNKVNAALAIIAGVAAAAL